MWYVITNETNDIFVSKDATLTNMLTNAFIGPYGAVELFKKVNINKEIQNKFYIKKLKIV